MIVTLFVIGSVIFTSAVLKESLNSLQNKADINVYFVTNADPAEVISIQKSLQKLPEVASVKYVSKEQVLEDFKKDPTRTQGDFDALDIIGENPFGPSLNILAKDPAKYTSIAQYLAGKKDIISANDYDRNGAAIAKLSTLIKASNKAGFGIAILLIAFALIITFNTIRVSIFASRDEIAVMKLVGASNRYARGPFVVSGIMYGLIAGIITLIIFAPTTYFLGPVTKSFFSSVNLYEYYRANFGQIFLIIVGSGLAIGAISSYLAVRRYLKV